MRFGQSNVDYIRTALECDPDLHAIEVECEWLRTEGFSERAATDLAMPSIACLMALLACEFRQQIEPARSEWSGA